MNVKPKIGSELDRLVPAKMTIQSWTTEDHRLGRNKSGD